MISELFNLDECPCRDLFEGKEYPWEVLGIIEEHLRDMINKLDSDFKEIKKDVWVGKGTKIADSALIDSPTIIGKNCDIRHGAYIRGKVIIGDNVVIGNSSELKNSIVFNNAQIPHFNYVGDSILRYKAHIGAGVKCSNLKSDKSMISIMIDGELVHTGLRKIGAIIGNHVEVGCNSVLNPGSVIGKNTMVYPLTLVRGVIPANSILKNTGELIAKR